MDSHAIRFSFRSAYCEWRFYQADVDLNVNNYFHFIALLSRQMAA